MTALSASGPTGARDTEARRHLPRLTWRSLVIPLVAFQFLLCFAPQLYFYRLGLAENVSPGVVDTSVLTFENFREIFSDPFYRSVILKTLQFGAMMVVVCGVLGFPLAYVISRSDRLRAPLLLIVLVTSFMSVIVKVLGWRILLGDSGPINDVLRFLHLTDDPLRLVNSMTGAVIGTAHAVLPFVVLLLVPVIDQVPRQLEHAAAGLGASRARALVNVVVPECRAGLIGGALITFAYAMGSFTTPSLLGGKSTLILPILIRQQVTTTVDYALAAALSLTLMVIVLIVTIIALRLTRTTRVSV
jgi:putative spermidine/putrescine transport system permease protein